jgi:hypothetical protein
MDYCTVYILSYINSLPVQVGGGGRISLFNSKCKHSSEIDNDAMNFISSLAICFQIATGNQKQGGAQNFKGLSQDGRQTDLKKTSAPHSLISLCIEPNKPTFSQIHLGEQCLYLII